VHPKVVSERLGHASIGITLDTYSHVMPGMQEETPRRSTRDLGRHWLDRRDWHQDEEMMRGSSETV
jgi:integrase